MTNTDATFWGSLKRAKVALAEAAGAADTEREFDAVNALINKLVLTEKRLMQ